MLIPHRRQKDDRNVLALAIRLEQATGAETIKAGHADIKQYQIKRREPSLIESVLAAKCNRNTSAMAGGNNLGQHAKISQIVIDKQ